MRYGFAASVPSWIRSVRHIRAAKDDPGNTYWNLIQQVYCFTSNITTIVWNTITVRNHNTTGPELLQWKLFPECKSTWKMWDTYWRNGKHWQEKWESNYSCTTATRAQWDLHGPASVCHGLLSICTSQEMLECDLGFLEVWLNCQCCPRKIPSSNPSHLQWSCCVG